MSDCVPQNGTSACYIANNTMQHCMPGTYAQGAKQLGRLTPMQTPHSLDPRFAGQQAVSARSATLLQPGAQTWLPTLCLMYDAILLPAMEIQVKSGTPLVSGTMSFMEACPMQCCQCKLSRVVQ